MKQSMYDIPIEKFSKNKKVIKGIIGTRYFEIVRLRCEEELTMPAIAELYGITTERIRQILGKSYYLLEKEGYVEKLFY